MIVYCEMFKMQYLKFILNFTIQYDIKNAVSIKLHLFTFCIYIMKYNIKANYLYQTTSIDYTTLY